MPSQDLKMNVEFSTKIPWYLILNQLMLAFSYVACFGSTVALLWLTALGHDIPFGILAAFMVMSLLFILTVPRIPLPDWAELAKATEKANAPTEEADSPDDED